MNEEEMVRNNLGLVNFVLHKYFPYLAYDEDAFQWGCLGLLMAVRYYDPAKAKFSTYGAKWIWTTILKKVVRPSQAKRRKNEGISSLSQVAYQGDDGTRPITLEEVIPDSQDIERAYELAETLAEAKNVLDEREAKVIELKLMGYTQKEIGKMIGISQVQVGRIEKKAIEKMRAVVAA